MQAMSPPAARAGGSTGSGVTSDDEAPLAPGDRESVQTPARLARGAWFSKVTVSEVFFIPGWKLAQPHPPIEKNKTMDPLAHPADFFVVCVDMRDAI